MDQDAFYALCLEQTIVWGMSNHLLLTVSFASVPFSLEVKQKHQKGLQYMGSFLCIEVLISEAPLLSQHYSKSIMFFGNSVLCYIIIVCTVLFNHPTSEDSENSMDLLKLVMFSLQKDRLYGNLIFGGCVGRELPLKNN